ncbi:HD-GYP domain-containing protein [Miltoncostaea oceani]|uniref:HD-GYP domain-containing protein n=1 Tax=Miltoncostaea oceani TaxID=2843216 RepID=UPI001C3D2756|nr:HD-GYP domain-containing protein [Miltoncostaea oceani]
MRASAESETSIIEIARAASEFDLETLRRAIIQEVTSLAPAGSALYLFEASGDQAILVGRSEGAPDWPATGRMAEMMPSAEGVEFSGGDGEVAMISVPLRRGGQISGAIFARGADIDAEDMRSWSELSVLGALLPPAERGPLPDSDPLGDAVRAHLQSRSQPGDAWLTIFDFAPEEGSTTSAVNELSRSIEREADRSSALRVAITPTRVAMVLDAPGGLAPLARIELLVERLSLEARAMSCHAVFSVGLSRWEADEEGFDGIVERAQKALETAVSNGGGIVVVEAGPPGGLTPIAHSHAGLRALAHAIDLKDPNTNRHSERVSALAGEIARVLLWSDSDIERLREAALVHDVGKIGVPDAILFKEGALTPAESEVIAQHAELGARIVSEILDPDQVSWVRSHHERWDGNGYPDGAAEDAIPEGALIISVADAFDAMTTPRHYRHQIEPAQARSICAAEAGHQFAPHAVEAFLSLGEVDGRMTQ